MNQPDKDILFIVDDSGHGSRIDQWVASLRPEYSRNFWIENIRSGRVLLNGEPCLPKSKLKVSDTIEIQSGCFVSINQLDNQPQDMDLDILYEDDHLLVINKPAGLVVHPGAGNSDSTLLNGLLNHHKEAENLPRAGIVHRLDKDTTGLLVIAKSLIAYTDLVKQLQNRTMKREYKALVYGHIISGDCIETCFGRHPRNRLKMAVVPTGKEAITEYSVNKQFHTFTLLDVQLKTGRTHQIRVHMAHIGHPIVGDALYGKGVKIPANPDDNLKSQLQGFKRQALHAFRLSLTHPTTGEHLTWTAPMPDDLTRLIDSIEANFDNHQS